VEFGLRRTTIIAAALFVSTHAFAASGAKAMYEATLEREQSVRAALESPHATSDALAEVRTLAAAYEAIVRRYPTSAYSDNALWQAGLLELDAFARFGDGGDRTAALTLLRSLTVRYPASSLAKRVPELLRSNGRKRPEPSTSSPGKVATIRAIKRTALPDAVRVTIELDTEVARFHEERIAGPDRVFLDLPATRAAATIVDRTLRFDGDRDIVRQVRVGRHPHNTTRVVLDAMGVSSYSVYALYNPYRLVIDCVRALAVDNSRVPSTPTPPRPPTLNSRPASTNARPATVVASETRTLPLAPLPARILSSEWGRRMPLRRARATALIASAREVEHVETVAVAAPVAPLQHAEMPAPPRVATATTGSYSIARQLGLSVSRIVIDPGHGGHDPGAQGRGVTEAELVLDVALRLEALLRKIPGVEVILTRRTDEFIPLPERTAIANREGADLFLSIHANASPHPTARGVETYFLNFADNLSAAAVAARENAASGQTMGALPDLVKAIALNNKVDESREFAAEVQRAMFDRLRGSNRTIKNLGVKQAPFVVLIGAAMPSVLAEISFVTNPQEAKLLRSSAYRQKIAEALLAAIRKYQLSLRNVTSVAHQ